jgi:hypothetical protein
MHQLFNWCKIIATVATSPGRKRKNECTSQAKGLHKEQAYCVCQHHAEQTTRCGSFGQCMRKAQRARGCSKCSERVSRIRLIVSNVQWHRQFLNNCIWLAEPPYENQRHQEHAPFMIGCTSSAKQPKQTTENTHSSQHLQMGRPTKAASALAELHCTSWRMA